ncbi:glycosyltransferase [Nocardioides sp. MAH-18]|uniref:Glycosyltransferase n=1 Tax=Nocardioides agri TaxID=2682843 RepID=A0A6L6XVV6_9ACTN|nr:MULTISPECIES: glycosyltransferase [unclassified Nocardioides]MBA2952164.1 glycosyltransferase [Nocardioides sp. CGMCC 1.13656]MVQ51330.1 glycosyltransferase [Nocardioides sp. MAH-18]
MTASRPSVLVVMPTLGERPATLTDAMRSALDQEGVDVRLVLVVPTAAVDARAVARELGADVVDDPRRGLTAAVNAGLDARRGEEFYAWLNDDDLFLPGALAHLAGLLEAQPSAVVAYGACDYIDPDGRSVGVSRAGAWATRILGWGPNLVPMPSSLIRLSALDAVGPYDESLKYAMDLDVFLRLRRQGRFIATPTITSCFRWHPDSITVANRALSSAESEAIKHRYLRPWVRPFAPLWDVPVRLASRWAAQRLNDRAKALTD